MDEGQLGDCADLVYEAGLIAYRLGLGELPEHQYVNFPHREAVAIFQKLLAACEEKPIESASRDSELTVAQAAKRINLSDQTIYRLARMGQDCGGLASKRYGSGRGTIRITLSDLLNYQQRQAASAKAKTGRVTLHQLRSA